MQNTKILRLILMLIKKYQTYNRFNQCTEEFSCSCYSSLYSKAGTTPQTMLQLHELSFVIHQLYASYQWDEGTFGYILIYYIFVNVYDGSR